MSNKKILPRTLLFTPSGVCANCLNFAHDICSRPNCACRLGEHDDSGWWVPTDAAVRIVDVVRLMERLMHKSGRVDACGQGYGEAMSDVQLRLATLNFRLFNHPQIKTRKTRCRSCKGRGQFTDDMMGSSFSPCERCDGSGEIFVLPKTLRRTCRSAPRPRAGKPSSSARRRAPRTT